MLVVIWSPDFPCRPRFQWGKNQLHFLFSFFFPRKLIRDKTWNKSHWHSSSCIAVAVYACDCLPLHLDMLIGMCCTVQCTCIVWHVQCIELHVYKVAKFQFNDQMKIDSVDWILIFGYHHSTFRYGDHFDVHQTWSTSNSQHTYEHKQSYVDTLYHWNTRRLNFQLSNARTRYRVGQQSTHSGLCV